MDGSCRYFGNGSCNQRDVTILLVEESKRENELLLSARHSILDFYIDRFQNF